MSMLPVGLFILTGISLMVMGVLLRARERERRFAEILDLPFGERDVPSEAIEQRAALVNSTVGIASRVVEQFDAKGSLFQALERAHVPMRPGEFVLIVGCAALGAGAIVALLAGQLWFAAAAVVFSPVAARAVLGSRVTRRRKKFEAQFPEALTLIASSLSAGHTFLRAVQMMTDEAEPPISEEFARVVQETRLGDSLVDALERMAARLAVRDVEWVVQAIRVQQTVGGKLADLLHTLADFIRAREEVRREIDVLTAEGRISAYILGAMPVFLLIAISVMNAGYMAPMFRGWGYIWLGGTAMSVLTGVVVILKMVKIEV